MEIKNLSLKWSFAIYATVAILAALLISVPLTTVFNDLQTDITNRYLAQYQDEIGGHAELLVDGKVIPGDGVWIYSEDVTDRFSGTDAMLYDLYGVLSVIVVPVVFVLFILIGSILFYRRKLKKPLEILDAASARIASGDLDFSVVYDSGNEFGRLAASFETMRRSLYETNKDMWRMIEGRRRLNAAFAHDLRTPLAVLRGYSDFLQGYVPEGKIDSEKALQALATMDVYLKRLEDYTDTMSSLQKLESISLSPDAVEFHDFCERIHNAAEILAAGKSVACRFEGEGILSIDPAAVLQVTENLISNAVRYAQSAVTVTCSAADGLLSVTVRDDGPGFTPEALKNATEPYFRDEKNEKKQGETARSGAGHFGIGLYICRLLCEKHGGSLTLDNKDGGFVTACFAQIGLLIKSL